MKKEDGFPGQISFIIPEKILTLIKKNPLINDLYITDIGYYPEALHHFRKRIAGSDQFILIYCIKGEGEIRITDTVHTISADHFFIIPKETPHAYRSMKQNPWSIYWIHFSGNKSGIYSRFSCLSMPIERNTNSRINARSELFSEIFSNLNRGFSNETLEYVNLCLPHLLASFTHLNQFRLVKEPTAKDPVSRSINYMLEHLSAKLKLSDIISETGLSSSHFSRLFVNKTGHPPIDYFIQLKIQHACRLLDNTNLTIADIAREMGFDDQFYFSRVFCKVMGKSPSQYRKN